jgi:hypothetical protein
LEYTDFIKGIHLLDFDADAEVVMIIDGLITYFSEEHLKSGQTSAEQRTRK